MKPMCYPSGAVVTSSFLKLFSMLILVCLISACGGGSGGASSSSGTSDTGGVSDASDVDGTDGSDVGGTDGSDGQDPTIVKFTLSYVADAGGTISGIDVQTVEEGDSGSQVTAIPDNGYYFLQWSDSLTDNPRIDTDVKGNKSVTAEFVLKEYSLTYNVGTGGSISGNPSQVVSHGEDGSEVIAVADTGYTFVQWSDGGTNAVRTDTSVTANSSVTAEFTLNEYNLSYSAGAGGSIVGTSLQNVNHGNDGSPVTAAANTGYGFIQWSDGVATATRTDTNVTGNITVSASFEINLVPPDNVTPSAGDSEVTVTWSSVAVATDYCVYVSDTAGINPATAASYDIDLSTCIGSTATSYIVAGLTNDNTYYFVVTAKGGGVESVVSDEVTAKPESVFVIRPMNDTGITLCQNYASTYDGGSGIHKYDLDCAATGASQTTEGTDVDGDPVPAGQDAVFGRDAQSAAGTLAKTGAGQAGFDFTKLDANGDELPASATEWSCVRDNVTGLIWEVKTESGLRRYGSGYTWYNSDNTNNGGYTGPYNDGTCTSSINNCSTEQFVADVNAAGLCGTNDWRLPTIKELSTIVHNGESAPTIDLNYFPYTRSNLYWSSSTRSDAGYNTGAWGVNFNDGVVWGYTKDDFAGHVRLVYGALPGSQSNNVDCSNEHTAINASTPTEDFTIHGDGTVTHHTTGLMWMRCSLGLSGADCTTGTAPYLNWYQSLEAVQTANAGAGTLGYTDWRLPNKNELASIVEQRCWKPAINEAIFPSTVPSWYSTSSPGFRGVDFNHGGVGNSVDRVRLVRTQTEQIRNRLTVTRSGAGEGKVTSNLEGINCVPACTTVFDSGQSVTITATPLTGSTFEGWSGSCSGTSTTCVLTMTEARNVTALFEQDLIAERYQVIEDGSVVRDIVTGLEWQRCSVGQTWSGSACTGTASTMDWDTVRTLTASGGFSLPNKEQLRTLVYCSNTDNFDSNGDNKFCSITDSYQSPTIQNEAFPNVLSNWFWSTTVTSYKPYNAWAVNFEFGDVSTPLKVNEYNARLVRDAQCPRLPCDY